MSPTAARTRTTPGEFFLFLFYYLCPRLPADPRPSAVPFSDGDYDHIVPAVGYTNKVGTSAEYSDNDTLTFYSLFGLKTLRRSFGGLPGGSLNEDAASEWDVPACQYGTLAGGCLPPGKNYGVAITGVLDAARTSRPVRLAVDRNSEPNVSEGEKPVGLKGTVTVSALTPGKKYRLQRYNSAANVPTAGDAKAFLKSKFDKATDFTASGKTWTYKDPLAIMSNGSAYYRCVQV